MLKSRALLALLALVVAAAGASCTTTKKMGPMEMGIESFDAQDYETASTHFQSVLAAGEDARAEYYLGRIALQSGDQDGAVAHLEKAVTLDDANSEYHFRLGVAYAVQIQKVSFMEKGQIAPKLKEAFEKAVATDPGNVDARLALAQYYLNAPPFIGGSEEKAMEQIDAVRDLDPMRAHLFRAELYSREKDYDAAIVELTAAMKLDPEDVGVHYRLGLMEQTREDFSAAFAAFEECLRMDPAYTRALYQIGRTAVFAGENMSRGVECLNLYLSKATAPGEPTWAHARWRLGMLYEKMGKIEDAKKAYQAALDLDPEVEGAKEALERLAD